MMLSLALLGRPNVGKSSLFNRLCRKKLAIVDDTPGVTRDFKIAEADIGGYQFRLIDTAGIEDNNAEDPLNPGMQSATRKAVAMADVLLFVVDGQVGITPVDENFARYARQTGKPVILLVNKADDRRAKETMLELYRLGFEEAVMISATHGHGVDELLDALEPYLPEREDDNGELSDEEFFAALEKANNRKQKTKIIIEEDGEEFEELDEEPEEDTAPLHVAIVGRPNAGKSTLLNALLCEERAIASPVAGTTRDAVIAEWEYDGRKMRLVDTAGLRKKAKIVDKLEKMSAAESLRAIRLAHVVVVVIDGTLGFDHQDQDIARLVVDEGRALVLAINKWDAVEDKEELREKLKHQLGHALSQVKDVPMVMISALKNRKLDNLMQAVLDVYGLWNKRIGTGKLNRWLDMISNQHPPPMVRGRANRLRYMTQIKSRPPTFALWSSQPKDIPDHYTRYLVNNLRRDFDLPAVPIRMQMKARKNPYIDKDGNKK
jgi:GTP-binding protein